MARRLEKKEFPAWGLIFSTAALLVVFCLAHYLGYAAKPSALLAGLGILLLLVTRDVRRLWNWPSVFLLGYVAFSLLTAFWAMSGKFFLREYSKIVIATFAFLLVVLWGRSDRRFAQHVLALVAGISALCAVLSVEAASTGVVKRILEPFGSFDNPIGFSTRLSGIFGNSNIEASIYAIGIIFSVALVCGAEKKWQRALWTAALSACAFAFLLAFSMGAMACFAVAVVIYLIFAGSGRCAALLRMVEAAVLTLVCALLAMRSYGDEKEWYLLMFLLADAAVVVALELAATGKLVSLLEAHQKLALTVMIGLVMLVGIYAVAALNVSAPHTFGSSFSRSVTLTPGEHVLLVEADGEVSVEINSTSVEQVMRSTSERIYRGPAAGAEFTVPEESESCTLYFYAEEGVTLSSVAVDETKKIVLTYRLLPAFAANRLQNGFLTGRNSVIRRLYWQDGLKLFALSPIVGHGVGAFETGITQVQEYKLVTRYVHNHYIQILLEDGVVGFALFVAALVAMASCLWKKRKQEKTGAFFWVYPALCAELVMNALQMLWDASMSYLVFLIQFYATVGLIVVACAESIRGKAGELVALQKRIPLPARLALAALPAFFVVTLIGNMFASRMRAAEVSSNEEAYRALERATGMDFYEHNDAMLSYILFSMEDESGDDHRDTADRYAEKLSKAQSNQIPYYLVWYYFNTGQYAKSIDEAKLGATYSASDPDMWDQIADLLRQGFIDSGAASPLIQNDEDRVLMTKLAEYRGLMLERNETALRPLTLNENSRKFFDTVGELEDCDGNRAAMLDVLAAYAAEEQSE